MLDKKRILIVDDSRLMAKVLELELNQLGHETLSVDKPEEALEKALLYMPHLVFLDIEMPHKNGFEVLQEFTADQNMNMPVIMLTASHNLNDIIKSTKLGAVDYLLKPLTDKALHGKLEKHLK
ncbi:MAG: response regulator [Leptospirales bacterium]